MRRGIKARGMAGLRLRSLYPTARFVVGWSFARKQISRFARNDKGLGFVEAGLDTLLPCHSEEPQGDEESAVLQFWSKTDFSLPLEMTMFGVVSRACPQICCTHEMSS